MKILDCLLSNYQWYRKHCKGTWYYVIPRPYPYMDIWSQYKPSYWEHLCRIEEW